MKRWHEQVGGRPGIVNRRVHFGHPVAQSMTLCGHDVYGADMSQIDRSPINCSNCARMVLACKAVPSIMLAESVKPQREGPVITRRKVA